MTVFILAALAAALLVLPGGAAGASRLRELCPVVSEAWWRPVLGRLRRLVRRGPGTPDPMRMAATLDLLAACLRAGLPVSEAVRAVADGVAPGSAAALRSTADLLELGADPVIAWAPVQDSDGMTDLARAARRTARSGTALAEAVVDLSGRLRAAVLDEAEARAQRAAVLVAGPLGLCFLPAFLCLGVVPVVAGLAAGLTNLH